MSVHSYSLRLNTKVKLNSIEWNWWEPIWSELKWRKIDCSGNVGIHPWTSAYLVVLLWCIDASICIRMYTYVWVVSGCVWVWSHNRLVATIMYGCQTRSFMLVSFKCYARFWPRMPTIVKYSTHTHICILCVYLVTHNTCTLGYTEKVSLSNMS